MTGRRCFAAIGLLSVAIMLVLGSRSGMTQSRAHVYLFRGLADVFSLGMDTLANELNARGIGATSHSHNDWKLIADKAAINYKAGKEGPIILVGHSLGADAVMEMADYLGDRGVPVALVVPFDATQSFPAPGNVARVLNLTQRDYAYMRPGPGFRGSLRNVDLSSDPNIDHLNIDKSPRLHALVIGEVLSIVGGHRIAPSVGAMPALIGPAADVKPMAAPTPGGEHTGAMKSKDTRKPMADNGTPGVAQPAGHEPSTDDPAVTPPPTRPAVEHQPVNSAQIPD
jgi:pimeloyl-ACP methyl ester carboxylesterase